MTTKSERLDLRLTPEQEDAIVTAAALSGRSVSDFSTQVLTDSVQDAVARDRQLRVDTEAFEQFAEILERPAEANAALDLP